MPRILEVLNSNGEPKLEEDTARGADGDLGLDDDLGEGDLDDGAGDGAGDDAAAGEVDDHVEGEEEQVLQIGDETLTDDEDNDDEGEDGKPAPAWVREVRRTNRELHRKNRELEARLEKLSTTQSADQSRIELGKKPTLEDFDYDAEKYEAALESYHDRKRKLDDQLRAEQESQRAQEAAWKERLAKHEQRKAQLKFKDFNEVEAAVDATMSVAQIGMIVHAADDSALLKYAIGKNPKRLAELASITDPIKFAFAVAKLEGALKLTNRRKPAPEKTVATSSSARQGSAEATLERLRAKAAETGDMTPVIRYKRKMREAAAQKRQT